MREERDKSVSFALAKEGCKRRDAKDEFFEVRPKSGVWRSGEEGGLKVARAVDNVDGVLCAKKERALAVVVGILVGEGDVSGACAERNWTARRMGAPTCVAWCGGPTRLACARREKTCRGSETIWAASLIAPDAWNSLGEEEAAKEAPVWHIWKRKWKLERGRREGE